MQKLSFFVSFLVITAAAYAQSGRGMDFEQYNPVSTLVVPEHPLTRAKYPFIDVHNHQNGLRANDIKQLLQDMDKLNMQVMVNLSGGYGGNLRA